MNGPERGQGADSELAVDTDGDGDERVTGGELGFTAALVAIAIGVGILALGMDGRAAVWPRILAGGFVALTVADFLVTCAKWRAQTQDPAPLRTASEADDPRQRVLMVVWLVVFATVGVLVGFGWATVVLVPAYQLMVGRRNVIAIAATTAGLAAAFHLLFGVVAATPIW